DAACAILAGDLDCAIAGGADSASDVPIPVSRPLQSALLDARRARGLGDTLRAFRAVRPRDLLPAMPALVERSTGLSMGESAEQMARANGISRAAQDEFAHRSHQLAAAAWADGRFAQEVMEVALPERGIELARDNTVRGKSKLEAYARLPPVFGDGGTVTAGNSSPLTDGAAAVLLMSEARAAELGVEPLGWLIAWAFTAIDPAEQMLLAPAWTIPRALDRAGLRLVDLALLDLHEAFAAQVLSVTARLGEVDWQRTNVMGGSIALGHPFAATGARQAMQVLGELRRRSGGHAVCSACAAGGLGAALVLQS
ncbi:MAG TPA: acetyl-CoA C-acyltransferase, partial [Kofleriaceae bacterium]|nr:acetyl-CoA C-acyltransferase [Kofleriaceae bacterium]